MINIAIFVVGLTIQGVAQFLVINRKLTQVCESVLNLRERCKERGGDHRHHFDGLENHGIRIENHEVRIVQLEQSKV